ncbi:MAG TPA: cation diffusion facilitator family transporter [Paenalcaligenes sp.]|nr:cation diffusion facilitator family transporter [Paenalcaligenes sp.]
MTENFVPEEVRTQAAHRSTMVSVWVNILLSILQLLVGILAKSQALIADAVHSFSDLIADGIVLWANKYSAKAPDDDHPYGHRRFETAATFAVGAILVIVGAGMIWNGINKLQQPGALDKVGMIALPVALVAIIVKESLFRYMLRVAKRVKSTMLVANAWHARSDAASSLVVSIGIIANLLGVPMADILAAMLVGVMILRMGWRFSIEAFHDLTDRAVDTETEERITQLVKTTPGVLGLHDLKTRKMGDMIWVEVDIEMDAKLTIKEGHDIAVQARRRVMEALPVLDVMTHFDPVDTTTKELLDE